MEILAKTILVTDTLFIGPDHEAKLHNAGLRIERLMNPKATEDELIAALRGKAGYILGGLEQVTERVIELCPELRAIAFTGSDWKAFIPGHALARRRGITISNCPGAVSQAVAELAVAGFLLLTRRLLEVGRGGSEKFRTVRGVDEYRIGIVGMGPLGRALLTQLRGLGARHIRYTNRTRYPEVESQGVDWLPLERLLADSDAVFLAAASARGDEYITGGMLRSMPNDAVLVNCAFEDAIELKALVEQIGSGRIRYFQDGEPENPELLSLPPERFFWTRMSGYNTSGALQRASDMTTASIINMLNKVPDRYEVSE